VKQILGRTENSVDLGALIAIISQAYTASYRGSSLKVRRRYRRLIAALEKARAAQAVPAKPNAGDQPANPEPRP
jgi:hypothetical protein